jgi:hypothetical protein
MGASVPFGQRRVQNLTCDVAWFIDMAVAIQIILKFYGGAVHALRRMPWNGPWLATEPREGLFF